MPDNNITIIGAPSVEPTPQQVISVEPIETNDCVDDNTTNGVHNDLQGIQGGDATNRWHLDKTHYDAVMGNTHAPSGSNPFVTSDELSTLDSHLTEPLVVQLGSDHAGGATTGMSFTTENTLEDVLRAILIKEVFHTYIQPSFTSFTYNYGTSVVEVGSSLYLNLTATYSQGDAGTTGIYSLYKNNVLLSNANPYGDSFTIGAIPIQYRATQAYGNGPVINSNLGNPSPNPITAGVINSNVLTMIPKRKSFFGYTTNGSIPSTSNAIRNLNQSVFEDQLSFNINVDIGAKSVIFAIPSTRTLVSVVFHGSLTNDETGAFTPNTATLSVQGANNYTGITYREYWYTAVGTFTSACYYTVTIQ